MTIARHRLSNFPRSWAWDTFTLQYVAMGFDPISCRPFSAGPAPEPLEGNNLGLRMGGRVGMHKLVAVKIYASALATLSPMLPPASMSSTTSMDTAFLYLAAPDFQSARYTLDGNPFTEMLAENRVVLYGDSTEPSGARVVTRGMVYAKDLPVISAADLDRLAVAIATAGGERDDATDEQPLVNPAWPLDVQVDTLAGILRKVLRRLHALESLPLTARDIEEMHLVDDDEPAGDAKPRRAHRSVHSLPDEVG